MIIQVKNLPNRDLKTYVTCTRSAEDNELWYYDDTDNIYIAEKQLEESKNYEWPRVIILGKDIINGEISSNAV